MLIWIKICIWLTKIKPDKGSWGKHWHNVSPHLRINEVLCNTIRVQYHQNIVKGEKGNGLEEGSKGCSNQQGALAHFKPGEVLDDRDLRMWDYVTTRLLEIPG